MALLYYILSIALLIGVIMFMGTVALVVLIAVRNRVRKSALENEHYPQFTNLTTLFKTN
jgi:hypothetical protein